MENPVQMNTNVPVKYCTGCGAPLNPNAELCPKCGVRQKAPGGKNKLVAALLAFFLGGLGIHKFYLGRAGWGLLYLLLCWTFIPALVAFIEGILYLVTSDDAFQQKYGN